MHQREYIDKVPDEFPGSGDEYLLSKIDPGIRYVAEKNAQTNRKLDWTAEIARQAYNMALELHRREERLRSTPWKIAKFMLQAAIPALLGALVVKLLG